MTKIKDKPIRRLKLLKFYLRYGFQTECCTRATLQCYLVLQKEDGWMYPPNLKAISKPFLQTSRILDQNSSRFVGLIYVSWCLFESTAQQSREPATVLGLLRQIRRRVTPERHRNAIRFDRKQMDRCIYRL